LDQHVVTDLPCRKCGYNPRSLNIYHPCPECGEEVLRSVEAAVLRGPRRKRLAGKWRWIAGVCAGGNLLLVLAFYGVLFLKGITVNALGPHHQPPLAESVAGSIRQSAGVVSVVGSCFGLAVAVYCIVLVAIAARRRDTTTLIVAGACFIAAAVSMLLATAIGFGLAGI
jgi:hypothetical protein